MAVKFLDYNGLSHFYEKLDEQYPKKDGEYNQFLMADGSKLNGDKLVNHLPSDYQKKGGIVGLNAVSTDKPWFKICSITDPAKDQNRNIVLFVQKINASADACGILTINSHTGAQNQWTSGFLCWEYVGDGIKLEDFVYAHNTGEKAITEIWVKCSRNWECYAYEILFSSIGADRTVDAFTLENGRAPDGEESITPGFTTFTSSIINLQGHTVIEPATLATNPEFIAALAKDNSFVEALAANETFINQLKEKIN